MTYTLKLGYADDAPVAKHDAPQLSIGDEVNVDGAMWIIAEIGSTDPALHTDFICALQAPPLVVQLRRGDVEFYTSELAIIRRELGHMAAGKAAEKVIRSVLETGETQLLSEEDLTAIASAIHALERSGNASERLRAVGREVSDHLAAPTRDG